jgi:hypothetical protein
MGWGLGMALHGWKIWIAVAAGVSFPILFAIAIHLIDP